MKKDEFQDKVLEHLGSDKEWKKNMEEKVDLMLSKQDFTNGTVRKHQTWIDNATGRMAVIASISVMIGGALVNWIFDILKGK